MMRRTVLILVLLALLCVPVFAANGFWLDENAILSGMGERSWARGYTPSESYGIWTAILPIRTDTDVNKITVCLEMENEAVSPFKPQKMEFTAQKNADGIFPVKLSCKLYSDCQNGDYPAKLVIPDQNAEIPFVVRIRNGSENTEKPSVEIKLTSSDLTVGIGGECVLQITNRCNTTEMKNLVLHISEGSGDLLPAQSDTLSVGSLLPGESREISVPLAVSAGARVANYPLQVELQFDTISGRGEWKETLTVPVTQELRLEHGEVVMGDTVVQGGTGGISIDFMNMGAGEVKNVRMTLTMGDFVQEQTVLVGNIQPGESITGRLAFPTAKAALGSHEGEVTVRYEDAFGHEESFNAPVSITVEEPLPDTPPVTEEKAESSSLTWVLMSLCAVFALGFVVQEIWLRSKIHKLEEDKL